MHIDINSHTQENISQPLLDKIDPDSRENFIESDIKNPFARICCRTRRLIPTICDGTCGSCRQARETYTMITPACIVTANDIANGGDPDGDIIGLAEAKKIVERRLKKIQIAKEEVFHQRKQNILVMTATPGATLH